LNKQVVT